MKKISNYIFLVPIILIAIALRFILLDKFPPSLNWDEVSHGYNAYSILKTGRDEWGKILPISNFRAYGDYPLALNLYLTIPSIAIFGLNEFGIRFPHAILGVLTVVTTYFFVYGLTKKKNLSLLTSLLVAIDPWTVFTSRFVLQSNLSIFFLVLSGALFFNREKSKSFLPLSIVSFGLTLFSYHTTRIFSPLLLIIIILVYRDNLISSFKRIKKVYLISIFLLALFFVPLPFILFNPEARARSSVVFLVDEGATQRIINLRNNSKLPVLAKKLLFNRPTYFAFNFSKNYLDYFSPEFLFLSGGTQYQFSIPDHGLVYVVNLPFFFIGLLILVKKARKDKDYQVILAWLLLAPIPASITQERYAVLRSSTMIPLVELLSVIGLFASIAWLKSKNNLKNIASIVMVIYFIGLAYGLENYMTKYITQYPVKYSWAWQYGYKEAISYIKDHYNDYDKIIFTKKYGEPHEFILFYNSWDPKNYRDNSELIRFYQSNWYWVDRFDKYYFINDWNIPLAKNSQGWDRFKLEYMENKGNVYTECGYVDQNTLPIGKHNVREGGKCLLITSPGNVPDDKWDKLKTINFLDNKPAFEIYEIKPIPYNEYVNYPDALKQ
ncbi:phospholipid carrier-dependent glycosyltransferase [Candidatus Microgenomates bacterium]|nr:phospholipid carrier-dependent glycosyltransferase [Candidatus Microgenomates bacterium]